MSTLVLCAACEMGEHDNHFEHWLKAPDGVLGGAHCPCLGDCIAPNLAAFLPPPRFPDTCDPTMEYHADPHYLCVRPPESSS